MTSNAVPHSNPCAKNRSAQIKVLLRAGTQEAWRLVRHPIHVFAWLVILVQIVILLVDSCRSDACSNPVGGSWLLDEMVPYMAVATYAAASLLATRPRRTGTQECLASLPTGAETRAAISLMGALGPFAVSVLVLSGVHWCDNVANSEFAAGLPTFSRYALAPVTVLGAGLLAVLVARWLPLPFAPGLVMIGILAAITNANSTEYWDYSREAGRFSRQAWLTPLPTNLDVETDPNSLPASFAGYAQISIPWHLTYLTGLDLLIIVGVFLLGRYRWYAAAVAVPVLALTALAAVQQLE